MRAALDARPGSNGAEAPRPRVLFVGNADWSFLSHQLPIARALRAHGIDTLVAAADTGHGAEIESHGIRFLPLRAARGDESAARDVGAIRELVQLYRRCLPDLVHHVTIKAVLHGSLAARAVKGLAVVNAVGGRGAVLSERRRTTALRLFVRGAYRVALGARRCRTIFENPEDRRFFIGAGLVPESRAVLIRGSGVNCEEFHPGPPERGTPIVMLAARVLHAAEIAEFVEVARMMRTHSASPRFVLVGSASDGQPAGASTERLRTWGEEGVIEWWGERKRMAEVLRRASLFVLPASRAEGIPKVLLEAVASGQPIVAVDAPRYREVIQPGVNGYLVSPHDVLAMCHAIELLLRDASLRTRFSDASRRLALAEFSEEIVVRQTLSVYRTLLATRWPHAVSTVQPSRGVSPAPMEMHAPVC